MYFHILVAIFLGLSIDGLCTQFIPLLRIIIQFNLNMFIILFLEYTNVICLQESVFFISILLGVQRGLFQDIISYFTSIKEIVLRSK